MAIKLKIMTARLSIKLSKDLLKKVQNKSKLTGVSVSFIVRRALENWLKEK